MPKGIYAFEKRGGLLKKGHVYLGGGWTKGKSFTLEHLNKLSKSQIGKHSGERNGMWKGDKVGYLALHDWIKRELGKPTKCSNIDCFYPKKDHSGQWLKKPKKFHWANISGEYKRDLSDWHELCSSCNHKDGIKINKRFYEN